MTLPITHVATTDLSEMLNPKPGRRMELPGFDPEFVDFPDYIIRITDRIWHERKVELCHDYYSADCKIHTLNGPIIGAQKVVENTYATLKSFPDRVLDADNVIWSDEGSGVFYSSHLITSKMTNDGPSEFGDATGRKLRVRTIADCLCYENRIIEEWLVRDYATLVEQLGFDIDETAARLAREDMKNGRSLIDLHADWRKRTTSSASSKTQIPQNRQENVTAFAQAVLGNYWQMLQTNSLGDVYDFRVQALYPGNRDFYGHDEVGKFWTEFHCAVSDMHIALEHIADIPYLDHARDLAVRWSLTGTHSGDGLYGPASGAEIFILGVSHWRLINGRIREETTIWDDVAVRRQIETHRLAHS